MATDVRIVLITAPCGEPAQELAKVLVAEGLAACINRIPGVESTYTWEGNLEVDAEDLLIVKTTSGWVEKLTNRAIELHPYDVPEVLVLDVTDGSEFYLDWVRRSVI